MIIVGTAGHIDHGKSAVVKRLTGTDPDRLPEEQSRGMTIDLGFAFRGTPGGSSLAFVDVPGHERFVKNMIAGVGGIDVVMLVIAADDGWMPQSEEHFQIVRLLSVPHGLIVINKTDLVEPEWLELLEEEIREKASGSFLADSPIFKVSAVTGDGIDQLAEYLDSLPTQLTVDRDGGQARLYIDRSFVLPGIGGVVTGTLRGSSLATGQGITVWPSQSQGKIRSLRANNQDCESARPGQRTAATFTGIDKAELIRGGVISDCQDLSFFSSHNILALSVELLPDAIVTLNDRRRVVFITGTTEVEGEIRMLNKQRIDPGQRGIAFLRPDQPVLSLVGDHHIIRLPTPMLTLGGGQVLDHLKHFPRQKDAASFEYLLQRQAMDLDSVIITELTARVAARESELLTNTVFAPGPKKKAVKQLLADKTIASFKGHLYHPESLEKTLDRFRSALEVYLAENSHLRGVPNTLLQQVSPFDETGTKFLLDYMLAEGTVVQLGDKFNLVGRDMALKGKIRAAHDEIMAELNDAPFAPPKLSILAKRSKEHREAIKYIIETGEGYKCGADFIFPYTVWEQLLEFIRNHLDEKGQMAVGDLKDRFGITRKWAIPILEETDRQRITARQGDVRVKGERYGQ